MVGSPCSTMDSQESSPTPQFKSINALMLSFLYGTTLTSIPTSGKTMALTIQTFAGKVMSLLFSMLSRFFIALSSKDQCLFFSQLQSLSPVILEPRIIKPITVFIVYPCICHEVMEWAFLFFFSLGLQHHCRW